jgi:anti-sigma regulatory factor (Ser/Thr protein kinase)
VAEAAGRVLRLDADVARLAEVRAFVRDATLTLGGSAHDAEDLVQAVDEAACNVVLHGYRDRPGTLELTARRRGRAIEIQVLDRCPPFDPTTAPTPDLSVPPMQRRPGGMGIQLVRTMVDEVHHRARPGGGNELTLIRRLDRPAEED